MVNFLLLVIIAKFVVRTASQQKPEAPTLPLKPDAKLLGSNLLAYSPSIVPTISPSFSLSKSSPTKAPSKQPSTFASQTQALPSKRITRPKYANEPTAEPTVYVPPSIITFSNSFVPAFIPTNYFSYNIPPPVNRMKAMAGVSIGIITRAPTKAPFIKALDTIKSSKFPTCLPTTISLSPTNSPSILPTISPSGSPSIPSTAIPSAAVPTSSPSFWPTVSPSINPTTISSCSPTIVPTSSSSPSFSLTKSSPTKVPTIRTTKSPSQLPTSSATSFPSALPTKSFVLTSTSPSRLPTTVSATTSPPSFTSTKSPLSKAPSNSPSSSSVLPTTNAPVKPTSKPSKSASLSFSSNSPTVVSQSSISPTRSPSFKPTNAKLWSQGAPSWQPSIQPTFVPHDDDVTYHNNGSVILSPKIFNIYIGAFSSTTMDLIDYLAAHMNQGTPSWYSVVKSYSQVVNGKVSNVGAPSFIERWTFNPSTTTLDDGTLQTLIGPKIASRGLLNCTECIFAIIFNGNFQMAGWNGQGGYSPFCGYHTMYGYTDNRGVSYAANIAVIGDPYTTSPSPYWDCISYTYGATANNDPSGDSIATTYMHEIADVITDFDGNTWYSDNTGYEVSDQCNFNFGDSFDLTTANHNYQFGMKKFLVQTLFQPRIGCVSEYKLPSSVNQITYKPVTSPTKSPSLPDDISFHEPGGVVVDSDQQTGVTLYNVYLGSIQDSTKQLTDYFSSHISTTAWYQTLTTYFDYLVPKGWVNFNTKFTMGKSTAIQPTGQALVLTEADIQNYLLPLYNSNTSTAFDVYAVMFRGDFNVSIEGKYWLQDWCSYHGSFLILPQNYVFKYFLVGDPSTAPGQSGQACAPVSGNGRVTANGDLGGDSIAVGYAQQLAQTLTNSEHYTWYSDTDGKEVSSACLGMFGPGFNLAHNNSNIVVGNKMFLVQEIWQRGVGCTMQINK